MFCGQCGTEIKEGESLCPLCGTAVVAQPMAPMMNDTMIGEKEKKQINKTPIKKKPFIIGGIIVAAVAVAAIVVWVLFFSNRSIEKTIDKYMKAIKDEDEELALEIMFPKDSREDGEDWLRDINVDLDDFLEEQSDTVISISVDSIVDVDEKLSDMVEDMFDEADLDIKYEELKIVNIEIEYKKSSKDKNTNRMELNGNTLDEGKDLSQIFAYRVEKKWYIIPGLIEFCVGNWQSEDIQSAQSIAGAIQNAMGSEQVCNALQPYGDAVIDLESDFEYLPQFVQEEIMTYLGDVPTIQHTWDGATGFAFSITSNGVVVYISSENNLAEWQIYPSVEDTYYQGIVQESDEVNSGQMSVENEYSCVKLLSDRSPILGYWQSEGMGMYIGYNTSGGDEGFTVYSTEGVFHPYNDYSFRAKDGYLMYNTKYDDRIDSLEITVIDDEHLSVVRRYGLADEGMRYEYTFERGSIEQDIYEQYTGKWINCGMLYNLWEEEDLELIYDDKCGCIHEIELRDFTVIDYQSDSLVTLYNGVDTIENIMPCEGLCNDEYGRKYYREMYNVDGNTLNYSVLVEEGIFEFVYFREGSKDAEIAMALNAYNDYFLSIPYNSSLEYSLVYINDDDIPELYYNYSDLTGNGVLAYNKNTGDIISLEGGYSISYSYKEKEGIVYEYYGMHMTHGSAFYKLTDDGSQFELITRQSADYIDGGYTNCTIDGEPVDEQIYMDFGNKFGELTYCLDLELYSSILSAYDSLLAK